jgi:tetratricopeptide (TPR) repeat protein
MRALSAAVILSALSSLFGGTAHRKTEQGNALYADGAYEDALRAYTEALASVPDRPELQYDLGNTLYRKGDFAGASEAYSRALAAAPPSLLGAAAYNLGNALFRTERYEESVDAYRRALKADRGDADARRNLELALRALERRPPESPSGGEQDRPEEKGEPPPPGPDRSHGPAGDEDRPGNDGEGRPGPREPGTRPGELSAEEAINLLDRLTEMERDQLRRERGRARVEEPTTEKDW